MNFKFTKTKTIISIVIVFIFGWFLAGMFTCMGGPFCIPDFNEQLILAFGYGLIPAIILYIIWSLIEKKQ